MKHLLSAGRWLCHGKKRLIPKNDKSKELTQFMSHVNGLLPKSLFAWSKTFIDKSKACSRRCQNSPSGQGHVTVKSDLLVFVVLTGHGYLFFGYAPITWPLTGSFQNGLLRPKP